MDSNWSGMPSTHVQVNGRFCCENGGMRVACSASSAQDTLDRCTTHLVALQGGSRAGGKADRRLRPSAFCSSMLMQGVSLAAVHATVVGPLLVWQSGASYGRGASGARAAECNTASQIMLSHALHTECPAGSRRKRHAGHLGLSCSGELHTQAVFK
jgi:hypothetical protein